MVPMRQARNEQGAARKNDATPNQPASSRPATDLPARLRTRFYRWMKFCGQAAWRVAWPPHLGCPIKFGDLLLRSHRLHYGLVFIFLRS